MIVTEKNKTSNMQENSAGLYVLSRLLKEHNIGRWARPFQHI